MSDPRRLVAGAVVASVLALAGGAMGTAGCGSQCPGIERTYAGGTVTRTADFLIYETGPIDGAYLPYEGGVTYHLVHHLGVVPTEWQCWVSFDATPVAAGAGGATEVAGNQAAQKSATADEVIIQNQTCASYYLRCVLKAPIASGTSDAGSDGSIDGGDGG